MIIFPHIGNHGRLGNQLFQLAALKSLGKRNNCDICLYDEIDRRHYDGQESLLNFFNHGITLRNRESVERLIWYEYIQNNDSVWKHIFDENYKNIKPNTAIHGKFESEQYFIEYKQYIKDSLEFRNDINEMAEKYIDEIKHLYPGKSVVGIHIRRGDFINNLAFNRDTYYERNLLSYIGYCSEKYFKEDENVFLIFTGGSHDNINTDDITWCKAYLPKWRNVHFCEENREIIDFAILAKCEHTILTSKSTFGWWASYLNKNKDKKIYVPCHSIGPKVDNPDSFWSEEFIQVTLPTSY
jgi:hypothetical protein